MLKSQHKENISDAGAKHTVFPSENIFSLPGVASAAGPLWPSCGKMENYFTASFPHFLLEYGQYTSQLIFETT